jgi:hypothetical protein
MRKLTFQCYLKGYVRKLSVQNTNAVAKLAVEAETNHRLREPLLLYAVSSGKADLLLWATKEKELRDSFAKLAGAIGSSGVEQALEAGGEAFNDGCLKVYRSYVSRRDRPMRDDNTKRLMYSKIIKLQADKNVSNYRLYSDLRLNGSNVNAFLKHKATNKMSLDNLRKMLQYLENA